MQPLLRQAVARASRSRPWRKLPRSPAEAEARLLRPTNPLLFRAARPPSGLCFRCQMRSYSDSRIPLQQDTDLRIKKPKSDPLRILFCGSDQFSCAALEALYDEHLHNPRLIRSIDVVVRPGKPAGRGQKDIEHPPIKELAEKLCLRIFERDTFTGWDMPCDINLIIAVSFGLFVPPRLLREAKYGGLNLHPSLLPDLRGPAPLQHAILADRAFTGVSLQTLDEERFDHGLVLARTPPVAILEYDYAKLLHKLTPLAVGLLLQGLRNNVHVPPLEEQKQQGVGIGLGNLLHAPKITKQDRQIRPEHLPHLLRRRRALGPLWFWSRNRHGVRKRVIIEEMSCMVPKVVLKDTIFPFTVEGVTSPPSQARPPNSDAVQLKHKLSSASGVGLGVPHVLPLEIDLDVDTNEDSNSNSSSSSSSRTIVTTKLVVWIHEHDKKVCYLGPFRVMRVKVEGDKVRSATSALKDFLTPVRFFQPRKDSVWEQEKGEEVDEPSYVDRDVERL
ncbi:Formyltransferase [Hypoxylon sp. FL0890]|nr:Formyltransferase [Hypoxylon sp. FL0890]